jgi:peptide deformylase
MSLLEVLQHPDPRLRIKAAPVAIFDKALRSQIDAMYETMYASQGVGLAGTQVNFHQRIFTMDVSETLAKPMCIINPEVIFKEGIQYESEGCLSVPAGYDKVERALKIRLRAQDADGNAIELEAEGLMAACIQHEMDHLNGVLFIDHLSRLKQDRYKKKLNKFATR